jgi:hypothetical protein
MWPRNDKTLKKVAIPEMSRALADSPDETTRRTGSASGMHKAHPLSRLAMSE